MVGATSSLPTEAIARCCAQLAPQDLQRLHLLSIFEDTFGQEACATLWSMELAASNAILNTFHHHSLVFKNENGYCLYDQVREYARAKLPAEVRLEAELAYVRAVANAASRTRGVHDPSYERISIQSDLGKFDCNLPGVRVKVYLQKQELNGIRIFQVGEPRTTFKICSKDSTDGDVFFPATRIDGMEERKRQYDRLDSMKHDLFSVLEICSRRLGQSGEFGDRLSDCFEACFGFFCLRLEEAQLQRLLNDAIRSSEAAKRDDRVALHLCQLGEALIDIGKHADAMTALARSRKIAGDCQASRTVARVTAMQAYAAWLLYPEDQKVTSLLAEAELAAALDALPEVRALALLVRGRLLWKQGDLRQSLKVLSIAAHRLKNLGEVFALGEAYSALAEAHAKRGAHEKAMGDHQRHLRLAHRFGHSRGMVRALVGIAKCRLEIGPPEESISFIFDIMSQVERSKEEADATLSYQGNLTVPHLWSHDGDDKGASASKVETAGGVNRTEDILAMALYEYAQYLHQRGYAALSVKAKALAWMNVEKSENASALQQILEARGR